MSRLQAVRRGHQRRGGLPRAEALADELDAPLQPLEERLAHMHGPVLRVAAIDDHPRRDAGAQVAEHVLGHLAVAVVVLVDFQSASRTRQRVSGLASRALRRFFCPALGTGGTRT